MCRAENSEKYQNYEKLEGIIHKERKKEKTHKEGHSKGIQHKHEKKFEKVSSIWS
jgi:hypothetical protein